MTSNQSAAVPPKIKRNKISSLGNDLIPARTLLPLAEAAALANCKPQDLLHLAVRRRITLLAALPNGIDLRTYDDVTKKVGTPFLMKPQLLALRQSYCVDLELYGKSEQCDFNVGYLIDSSGQLKKLLPSYGHPELQHQWSAWRTFKGKSVQRLTLIAERLFLMTSELAQLLEPGPKSKQSADDNLKSNKVSMPSAMDDKPQREPPEGMKKESVNIGHDAEPEHHEPPPKSTAHAKRQKDQYDDPLNSAMKGVVIIRLKQVQIRTGLSRSTIYDRINPKSPRFDSTFPKQISLGSDAVGWIESEVNNWLESRKSACRD